MREHRLKPTLNGRASEELGRLIARAHYQAWRVDAPPLDLSVDELAAILPNLIKSGSAGIVWHRVKPFHEKYGALAYALEAAADAQMAHNHKVEEAVAECVTRLRLYGIEPVLVKGLALAKLYPEGIVRPAGDIDLVVRTEEFAAAHAILHDSSRDPIPVSIDLKHPGIWKEAPNVDFWDRLKHTDVAGSAVPTLGPVDNLVMACIHYWKHGGLRILWTVDTALLAELVGPLPPLTPYWQGSSQRKDRVTVLMQVVSDLLGAQRVTPAKSLTVWLEPALLAEWANADGYANVAMADLRPTPPAYARAFRERWSGPILATSYLDEPLAGKVPWIRQCRMLALRSIRWITSGRFASSALTGHRKQ